MTSPPEDHPQQITHASPKETKQEKQECVGFNPVVVHRRNFVGPTLVTNHLGNQLPTIQKALTPKAMMKPIPSN
jgi:hypothetical protein